MLVIHMTSIASKGTGSDTVLILFIDLMLICSLTEILGINCHLSLTRCLFVPEQRRVGWIDEYSNK